MWEVNAMRVIHVTEKGAIFNDETRNKLLNLSDLSSVMQFEIDAPFQGFQPHYHYNVQPQPEFQVWLDPFKLRSGFLALNVARVDGRSRFEQ